MTLLSNNPQPVSTNPSAETTSVFRSGRVIYLTIEMAGSDFAVSAVAHGNCRGMFASAEPDFPGLGSRVLLWRDTGTLVRSIAERLAFTLAAGAPPVFLTGLDIDTIR